MAFGPLSIQLKRKQAQVELPRPASINNVTIEPIRGMYDFWCIVTRQQRHLRRKGRTVRSAERIRLLAQRIGRGRSEPVPSSWRICGPVQHPSPRAVERFATCGALRICHRWCWWSTVEQGVCCRVSKAHPEPTSILNVNQKRTTAILGRETCLL